MKDGILQDWAANEGRWKSRIVLLLYRLAQRARALPEPWWMLASPAIALYVFVVEWVMGIELHYKSRIGPGLRLYHGSGIVVHYAVVMGRNCVLRHCTTLGMKNKADDCPVVGDNVDIGCNTVIIGPVRIGDNAVIGAGSVVLKDVAAGDVVAGNPARTVKSTA